ncbi:MULTISPECIES: hypothetical protein [unclassified Streptomyces]|uniref:hypothetical protein n=1 Tax=unclassified Streptomyces TaxID=2593676 RepID=UPI000DAC6155|nr:MULTISPECIES: hypothetical protein [unclassified Streptomyces]PZT74491.1 hypothetical protein DNK55_20530 [Streptomyces sp. AC1-42T]PZT82523.1 hypothetical protein DNK56_10915 [Streptomyces sp. AC1-42W]
MPSSPVSTRVPPYVHARLTERAAEHGTTLSALVASLLTAAVDDDGDGPAPRVDGPLVAAVRRVLEEGEEGDVDARTGVHRELCLLLARTVERREPGYLSAIAPLHRALTSAAPSPADQAMNRVLAGLL